MTRKLFFSFHYEGDVWRAANVRSSNVVSPDDRYGFIDAVDWEKLKKAGDDAIARWIKEQMNYTSATVVLVGEKTAERDWVDFEIRESWKRGNAIIAVKIHGIKDNEGRVAVPGVNPLENVFLSDGTPLSRVCKTYDWVADNGRDNLGRWADEAVRQRELYKGETNLAAGSQNPPRSPIPTSVASPTIIRNPSGPWSM